MLKKLKSAERLFLLIKKLLPFTAASLSKGKILNEVQQLVHNDPRSWLDAVSIWRNLLKLDVNREEFSQRDANPLKRKMRENEGVIAKKLKTEEMQKIEENHKEYQLEEQTEDTLEQRESTMRRDKLEKEEIQKEVEKAAGAHSQEDLTFRVSCRCSGAIGKVFTAQEVGRIIGIALMKQFGWKADLRNPNLEIYVHLNDIYTVAGIPLFRVPLASRTYIKTAGLRSTIAWAMASLAEIKVGTFVLDPMCGLGTILLEAAKEWPDGYYVGADVSDSQLLGAWDNLKAAGLNDKIELLKVSVIVPTALLLHHPPAMCDPKFPLPPGLHRGLQIHSLPNKTMTHPPYPAPRPHTRCLIVRCPALQLGRADGRLAGTHRKGPSPWTCLWGSRRSKPVCSLERKTMNLSILCPQEGSQVC
ncbi:THUMP domain-containing protein 2 isoform X4 [Fukomys damarensis]|uniref:THUMP domain-containing protein 2 isoform X4 n=1 Tax=Fukomys damarensis TaxID=885580 RepID=UPI0008FF1324|nr:THUMP domain-containing protein 2 isoform X4 [Fukomys damarensis]